MVLRNFRPFLAVLLAWTAQSMAFSFDVPKPFVRYAVRSGQNSVISLAVTNEVVQGDMYEKEFLQTPHDQMVSDQNQEGGATRSEYGALAPGTVVQVQVGDLSLARKAWKKRRRTGSPLLVPCSILNVDRRSMVRWNLMFLLEKFGQAQADGIQISASNLSQRYRKFLSSSLQASTLNLLGGSGLVSLYS